MDCPICIGTKSKSSMTVCDFCDINVCKNCVKTYIFDKKSSNIDCMGCRKTFSRYNLVNMLGKSFVNGKLNTHIKEVLYMEQKTLIPETLPAVALMKQKNELIEQNNTDTLLLQTLQWSTLDYFLLNAKIKTVNKYINNFLQKRHILNGFHRENTEKTVYVYPCANPECLGHVNSNWVCTMCKGKTCKECLVFIPENEEHECKKEDVDTAKLIKNTSKPCPGCKISIVKTEGCDQMWCVKCHIAFSWKTGKKETKNIHNPEYYRWMRENMGYVPREQGDNPCEDVHGMIYRKIRGMRLKPDYALQIVGNMSQLITHIEMSDIVRNRGVIADNDRWHKEQRINLLMKKTTEKQFKTNIARKYKERMYIDEEMSLITTLKDVLKDKLVYYFDHSKDVIKELNYDKYIEIVKDVNMYITECNRILKDTNELYGYSHKTNYMNITFNA